MIQTNINEDDLNQNSDFEQSELIITEEHYLIFLELRETQDTHFELKTKKQNNPNFFYILLHKGQFHYVQDLSIGMQIGVKGRFDRKNKMTIDNSESLLIIVEPHNSIGVTTIFNYNFCPRKQLISEVFRSPVQPDQVDQLLKETIKQMDQNHQLFSQYLERHHQLLYNFSELKIEEQNYMNEFYHFYIWLEKWKQLPIKVLDQFGQEYSIKLSKHIQNEIQLQEKFLGLNGRTDILVEVQHCKIRQQQNERVEKDNKFADALIDIKTAKFRSSDEEQMMYYLSLINYQKEIIQYGIIIYFIDTKVNQDNIKFYKYDKSKLQKQLDERNKYLLSNHKSQSQDVKEFFNNLPDPDINTLGSSCVNCQHLFICSYKNMFGEKPNQSLIEVQKKFQSKCDLTKISEKSKDYLNIMLADLIEEEHEHLQLYKFEFTVEILKEENNEYKLELLKLFDEKRLKLFKQFIEKNRIITIALYTETYQFTITKEYPFVIQYFNPFYNYKQIIVDLVGAYRNQNGKTEIQQQKLQLNKLLIQEDIPSVEQQIGDIEQNSSKEVQLCLNAKNYVLVQSGEQSKQQVLFELLKVLENQKKHVLICVENYKTLVTLCKNYPNKNIIAVPQKKSNELEEINKYLIEAYKCKDQSKTNEIWDSKLLYFSNCDDFIQNKFRYKKFDYCIVYEASKIIEPLCIICIWTSKKFILFGKSNEKPIVQSNKVGQLKISLFERLSKIAQKAGVFIDIDEGHQQMNN